MTMEARPGKLRAFCLLLPLLACLAAAAGAQPAFQVKDLNTTQSSGIRPVDFPPHEIAAAGGAVFLAASDGIHGTEPWRTDGTEAGTRLIADVCPGSCASFPRSFTTAGNLVFFLADSLQGTGLWASDGTPAGTAPVKLTPEAAFRAISLLAGLDGLLLFAIEEELWRSDGTAAGTFPLADFEWDASSPLLRPLGRLGGKLLFSARDEDHGRELWATDGTASGTVLLKDITPGPAGNGPGSAGVVAGGRVFFVVQGSQGSELWTSDGTESGTALVKVINEGSGSFIKELTALGTEVFFIGPRDGQSYALWKSDGTANGTGPVSSVSNASVNLTAAGNRLFFSADCDLFTSDGTGAGTLLVKKFRPDVPPPNYFCSTPYRVAKDGGAFLFFAYDEVHGQELWKSDGTPAGTALVADIYPGAKSSDDYYRQGAFINGRWYFHAKGGEEAGTQLWTSDGTAAGTRMLRINHQASGLVLRGPRALFDFEGTLLFQGNVRELWKSDGTPAGTSLVKDLSSLFYGVSFPSEFTRAGDTVFFRAGAGTSSEALWKTDGTAAGTLQIHRADYLHYFGSYSPRNLTALGDNLLFIGTASGELAIDLMKSDGTRTGTTRVTPLWQPPYYVVSLVSKGDMVLLQDFPDADYSELWRSDGTEAGTVFLGAVLSPYKALEDVSALRDGVLFFAGTTPESGEELWRTDGTVAGTYLVTEIVPGPDSKPLGPFTATGTTLFFVAGGHELWKNDAAGTALVRSLPGYSYIGSLTPLGEKVYFTYDDGVHGRELWVSDGTEVGTRMVEDILPGPGSSHPRELHAEGSILLFSATDGVHSVEPWRSDGTVVGTRMLQDIAPGGLPSSPVEFTASGPNIYFAANDGATGFELWALPRPALLATFADVPTDYWAWRFVEALAASGITGGCSPDSYCPTRPVTRAEAAVFLLRAAHGPLYTPPPATGARFTDVPASFWAGAWIEQLAAEGITSGCGPNLFCPASPLSRAEMAVFLLRAKHGPSYVPPPATGTRFGDVPAGYWAAAWIEQLAAEGITTGCSPNQFCPGLTVTRGEMAVFLVATFGLPLPPPAGG
jgi:ELWxxDGT repeat protein